jgi:hypothetical protein
MLRQHSMQKLDSVAASTLSSNLWHDIAARAFLVLNLSCPFVEDKTDCRVSCAGPALDTQLLSSQRQFQLLLPIHTDCPRNGVDRMHMDDDALKK